MARLKVRQIPFRFDETTAYYWNHGNPYWGNVVNFISVIGPAFERYFIKAIRQAMPQITDPVLREDAELFCLQEGQHSKQHLLHLQALIQQYPGLEETRQQVLASYEHLFDSRSLEFHLAYAATIELTFGPIAKFMVENREALFADCDNRVAALILWHFVEEFEHRNSANDVYKHIIGSYTWRMRTAVDVYRHIRKVEQMTRVGLQAHVPPLEWAGTLIAPDDESGMFRDVSVVNLLDFLWHLLCSQMPLHKPDRLTQPEWATRWFADEAAGKDMTVYAP